MNHDWLIKIKWLTILDITTPYTRSIAINHYQPCSAMIHHWTPPIVLLRLYSSFPSFARRTALQNCPPNATSPSIFLALRSPQALAWLSTPLSAPACAHLAGFASRRCSAHPAGPHLVWPPLPGLRNDYKHVKHEISFSNHFSQYYKILNITNMYLVIS